MPVNRDPSQSPWKFTRVPTEFEDGVCRYVIAAPYRIHQASSVLATATLVSMYFLVYLHRPHWAILMGALTIVLLTVRFYEYHSRPVPPARIRCDRR